MDRALVIGETGGIGAALAAALLAGGATVTGLSRRDGMDLTDPGSVEAALQDLPPDFDTILIATGGLGTPEKSLRTVSAPAMLNQFALNAVGPALVLRHAARLLPRDRRSVCGVLSARVGSIGDNRLGGWYGYRASKAALNQIVHTAAIELARSHPRAVLACLHPGTVATRFTENYDAEKLSPAQAATHLLRVLDSLGPEDSGGFFDGSGAAVPW